MCRFVENPRRSVLCVGHIGEERYGSMASAGTPLKRYRERLRSLYHTLAAEGHDTYLFTTWGRFEALSAGTLQITKPELIKAYGLKYVFSMGVFDTRRPLTGLSPAADYLDEVLLPLEDDNDLTTEELFATVLSEVSAVIYDNNDHDPFVHATVVKAFALGKRMVDVNSLEI
jgi:hypothetical protein